MKRAIILGIWHIVIVAIVLIPMAHADYGLMLGSFKSKDNAQKYLKRFITRQNGVRENAFLEDMQMPGKGIWYRVCLGPYATREDALKKQKLLQSRGHESVVVSIEPLRTATPSRDFRESISRTRSSSTGNVQPQKPRLISADPSVPKVTGGKSEDTRNRNIDALSSTFDEKNEPSVGASKTMATPQGGEVHHPSESPTETAIVSPGDIVSIDIPTQKQMSQSYDVDPEGRIFMMSIGAVIIGGLQISLVEKKIAKLLSQLIPKEEKVTVQFVDRMRYVNISGGIIYPGWYHVPQISNLDDLVEMAGGLVPGVDYSRIKLVRMTKSGPKEIKVKARISLKPNDVLMVPTPKAFERKVDSGDLLFINIPEKPTDTNLSEIERKVTQNQVEVDKSGYIYIPGYGHIYVKNLMTTEIRKIISSMLPKYLARSAKVHVSIIEKRHYVQIGGHVAKPGWYNIPESDNIQAALSAAGGAVDGAIMSRVTVTRKWGGKTRRVRVNLYQYTVTGDVRLLTPVQENDSVFVPISSAFGDVKRTLSQWQPPPSKLEEDSGTKVRIFGAVLHPGIYEPKEDMNVLDLLVLAGGNRDDADLAKTIVIRENKSVTYDLNDLILQSTQGAFDIPKVQNGDSVYVSFVKKAVYEKQEPKKMIRIFGAVKNPGIYEASPNMNIIDVLSLAKGQSFDADLKKVNIARTNGKFEKLNLQDFFDAKSPDPTKLPIINAGDTVYVHYLQHLNLEKKEPIYLLGKVENPGQYQLATGGMTVYQMIAYAGGFDEWADTENILVIRMVNGRQRNIPYSLRKALSGKYPELNIRLRPFDTIYVP
jgi:protein involved in polysaccharide export with SLBB domain